MFGPCQHQSPMLLFKFQKNMMLPLANESFNSILLKLHISQIPKHPKQILFKKNMFKKKMVSKKKQRKKCPTLSNQVEVDRTTSMQSFSNFGG